jgi:hypothetical protein
MASVFSNQIHGNPTSATMVARPSAPANSVLFSVPGNFCVEEFLPTVFEAKIFKAQVGLFALLSRLTGGKAVSEKPWKVIRKSHTDFLLIQSDAHLSVWLEARPAAEGFVETTLSLGFGDSGKAPANRTDLGVRLVHAAKAFVYQLGAKAILFQVARRLNRERTHNIRTSVMSELL